jgi:hypothetical protein
MCSPQATTSRRVQAFQNPIRKSRKSGMAPGSNCSALVSFPRYSIASREQRANDGLLLSRYNGEDRARPSPAPTAHSTAAPPPPTTAHQDTFQPLPSACPPTNNDVDEVDDDTLINQYDVSGGIGHEIFGALDTGGLEDVGEDEDEELDLADKGKCLFIV